MTPANFSSTLAHSALSGQALPLAETAPLFEESQPRSSDSSRSCGFFVPKSNNSSQDEPTKTTECLHNFHYYPSPPISTTTTTNPQCSSNYPSTEEEDEEEEEEDNKPTYYLIAATRPKRPRRSNPHPAVLTPATTPPQLRPKLSNATDFWTCPPSTFSSATTARSSLDECVFTNNPGYLSPESGFGSATTSPYSGFSELNLCSPTSFTSTPPPNFCEPFSSAWEGWLDEIVQEVQLEMRAESIFHELTPASKQTQPGNNRKRKISSRTSEITTAESEGERDILDLGNESSSSCSDHSQETGKERAKKYSLAALSHEEIAQRKKEQNRIAAQRYRSRKTQTLEEGRSEIAHFEKKNAELKKEEAVLSQEIQRLKELLVGLKSGGDAQKEEQQQTASL